MVWQVKNLNMNKDDTFKIIKNILEDNFEWIQVEIHLDHRLREDLSLDSIAMVNLQVAIEDKFDFRFDPTEMDLVNIFESVNSLVDFLLSL